MPINDIGLSVNAIDQRMFFGDMPARKTAWYFSAMGRAPHAGNGLLARTDNLIRHVVASVTLV
ncbi:MAG TPA: hypothetical protein VGP45_11090, partial [Marinobacter sp.]|nr:hypothetical protein [Marinobacter sp.]